MRLTDEERAIRAGDAGAGATMAMRIVLGLARAVDAPRLLPVESAHVDGCLYHGRAGLDFARRLVELGGQVSVPTTLNVGSLDLLHPGLVRRTADTEPARELMDAYVALGCRPTWTCAPYQLTHRPEFGSHVAWAESNAVAFVNSVLGARTDRYGDFLDISAAIVGRVPDAGLHRTEHRKARLVVDVSSVSQALLDTDVGWAALGYAVGRLAGTGVPAVVGVRSAVPEERLKAFGAAAASAGGVGLFHVVGVTPEAPTLDAVWPADGAVTETALATADLAQVHDELSTAGTDRIDAVSLGTPHFSVAEFAELSELLAVGGPVQQDVSCYVSTSRAVLDEVTELGYAHLCERVGVRILVDTCTYVAPVLDPGVRVVMTNSGKWASYAPTNIGVAVVLGSLAECVASARDGRVRRDAALWR
ncbi:MAG: DUF521 domain-containing protein [Streptosporangiales bacterium]|nr:DUF521 domain-containing protein [Streptosporangiales bacterium]